jgi:N-acetylglutamate synthase-like GNAT family acetyltransferase
MKTECKEIDHGSAEYEQTIALRQKILREPLGLQFSEEELLAEKGSFHLTCWSDGELVACVVLSPLEEKKVRMRQFAVSEDYQRQGIGRILANYLEAFARELGCREIVLHARESAAMFYQKLGYSKGEDHFIEVTLLHCTMWKRIA